MAGSCIIYGNAAEITCFSDQFNYRSTQRRNKLGSHIAAFAFSSRTGISQDVCLRPYRRVPMDEPPTRKHFARPVDRNRLFGYRLRPIFQQISQDIRRGIRAMAGLKQSRQIRHVIARRNQRALKTAGPEGLRQSNIRK